MERTVQNNNILLTEQDQVVLSISEMEKGDSVEITLEGNLRNDTAHCLEDELKVWVLFGKSLIVNMEKVKYLSHNCSQVFLSIQRTVDNNQKGLLRLTKVPTDIMQEMREIGLAELLNVEGIE